MNLQLFQKIITVFTVFAFILPSNAKPAVCRKDLQLYNILATSLLTAATAAFRQKRMTAGKFLKAAFWGAMSGYGFYNAKSLAAKGNVLAGLELGYLSSSVAENVTYDLHPLAYFRQGVAGPIGVRFPTPFAEYDPERWPFSLDIDMTNTLYFLHYIDASEKWFFKDGILTGSAKKLPNDYEGAAYGNSIVLQKDQLRNEELWRHEAIHVIQSIQLQSFSANFQGCNALFCANARLSWLYYLDGRIDGSASWENRWSEIEAARLASDQDTRDYINGTSDYADECDDNIQVTFTIAF